MRSQAVQRRRGTLTKSQWPKSSNSQAPSPIFQARDAVRHHLDVRWWRRRHRSWRRRRRRRTICVMTMRRRRRGWWRRRPLLCLRTNRREYRYAQCGYSSERKQNNFTSSPMHPGVNHLSSPFLTCTVRLPLVSPTISRARASMLSPFAHTLRVKARPAELGSLIPGRKLRVSERVQPGCSQAHILDFPS